MDFAEFYDVPVEPLPEWSHRPYEEYRSYVADLVHQIEEEHFERRRVEKPPVLGRRKIRKADPR